MNVKHFFSLLFFLTAAFLFYERQSNTDSKNRKIASLDSQRQREWSQLRKHSKSSVPARIPSQAQERARPSSQARSTKDLDKEMSAHSPGASSWKGSRRKGLHERQQARLKSTLSPLTGRLHLALDYRACPIRECGQKGAIEILGDFAIQRLNRSHEANELRQPWVLLDTNTGLFRVWEGSLLVELRDVELGGLQSHSDKFFELGFHIEKSDSLNPERFIRLGIKKLDENFHTKLKALEKVSSVKSVTLISQGKKYSLR